MRPGWAKEKPINLNPLRLSWMKGGQWRRQGDCLSRAFCLIVIIFKFESELYLQMWLHCCDSSNPTTPFTVKGPLLPYPFIQLEFHFFLTEISIATMNEYTLPLPLTCLSFPESGEVSQDSWDASSWAGRGSCLKPSGVLAPNTLL